MNSRYQRFVQPETQESLFLSQQRYMKETEKSRHDFRQSIRILTEDAAQLYIVAVNTFNGVVKLSDGRYLSTDRRGSGIGISSVVSTAESYGGVALFSHSGTEFYSNVAIPIG